MDFCILDLQSPEQVLKLLDDERRSMEQQLKLDKQRLHELTRKRIEKENLQVLKMKESLVLLQV